MAVRNLDSIQRKGAEVYNEKANARKLKADGYWRRVNIVKESHDDAVDALDTIQALFEHGLRQAFEEWMKGQGISYSNQYKRFEVRAPYDHGYSEAGYEPLNNDICFHWSGHGCCESYSANSHYDRLIDYHIGKADDRYDELLTRLAEKLQPFLDAFFKWTETL